jgi:hypothetical protein
LKINFIRGSRRLQIAVGAVMMELVFVLARELWYKGAEIARVAGAVVSVMGEINEAPIIGL